ncbi:MAG TPA: hypothetical protein PKL84_11515, partial [Candidatus Hydrogenedentes bacterium]|nr:hypothetical protein [Candidatus Hydrogenedentota bacterium]
MGRHQALYAETAECFDRLVHAFRTCRHKMHSADDGVNRPIIRQGLHVLERIDNAGVRTAEDNDGSFRCLEIQGLVVGKRIGDMRI